MGDGTRFTAVGTVATLPGMRQTPGGKLTFSRRLSSRQSRSPTEETAVTRDRMELRSELGMSQETMGITTPGPGRSVVT